MRSCAFTPELGRNLSIGGLAVKLNFPQRERKRGASTARDESAGNLFSVPEGSKFARVAIEGLLRD